MASYTSIMKKGPRTQELLSDVNWDSQNILRNRQSPLPTANGKFSCSIWSLKKCIGQNDISCYVLQFSMYKLLLEVIKNKVITECLIPYQTLFSDHAH